MDDSTSTRSPHVGFIPDPKLRPDVKDLFHGPLILSAFYGFLKWTDSYEQDWGVLTDKAPVGALALAATAVYYFI